MRIALFALALASLPAARAQASGIAVVNVTPAFHPGTYVALSVDARDPNRVAVTSEDGVVSVSDDGGRTARTASVVTPREYVSAPLRSLPSLFTLLPQGLAGRAQLSGLVGESPGTRYFLLRLKNQQPVAKWQSWMAVENPATALFDVAWQPPSSLLVASAAGLFAGGARSLGFVQLLGAPRPRGDRGGARALDVDPADPARVLVATREGVLVSTNGGRTFAPHPDLADVEVRRFSRDPDDLTHLFALASRTLFQSRDGGRHFEAAFSSRDELNAVAVDERGAYLATGRGLIMPPASTPPRWRPGEAIVGVVALGGGWLIAASEESVWLVDDHGEARTLLRAGGPDPIARLEGSGAAAYVLTRHSLYRLTTTPLARAPATEAPRLLVPIEIVVETALRRAGLADPSRTRLGAPWWAALAPRVTVALAPTVSNQLGVSYDALLPFPERLRRTGGASGCCGSAVGSAPADFTILVGWNLAGLVSRKQPTYPFSIVEMNLRAAREQIRSEVLWRYRDAATIAGLLARPTSDELQQFLWESRLSEQAAYLEAMTGYPVVAIPEVDLHRGESCECFVH